MTAHAFWRRVCETLRLMVGQPDYDRYVAHRLEHHPGETVMSRVEFFRDRQDRRYATRSGGGLRCC
ncbi:MAG TPA: YbdD/YjiX family protein [Stellaceae bacterium]|nr:YbdD/YjiX family protein [Stellaceae bacterium]